MIARTPHQTQIADTSGRYDSIQILRAVAAMAVVLVHVFNAYWADYGVVDYDIFPIGYAGVDMFFVISGFIICHAAQNETSAWRFMLKRMFRIIPLYYALTLGLFCVAALVPSLLKSASADFSHLIQSLLFIPYERPNGVIKPLLFLGWTLNYEMFFYVIFAIGFKLSRRPEIFTLCTVFILAIIGAITDTGFAPFDFLTDSVILNFAWGCLVYLLHKHIPGLAGKMKWYWPVAIGFLLIQNWYRLPLTREFAFGLPSAFLLLTVLHYRVITGPIGNLAKTVGDASYSLYLSHAYVLQVIVKLLITALGVSTFSVAIMTISVPILSTLFAICLFKFWERPSNTWLRSRFLTPGITRKTHDTAVI